MTRIFDLLKPDALDIDSALGSLGFFLGEINIPPIFALFDVAPQSKTHRGVSSDTAPILDPSKKLRQHE